MSETKANFFSFKLNLNFVTIFVIAISTAVIKISWNELQKTNAEVFVVNEENEEIPENEKVKNEVEVEKSSENFMIPEIKRQYKGHFWFHHKQNDLAVLETAGKVLERLNFAWIPMNATSQQTIHYNWDLLWSYEHFCEIPLDWNQIQYHQKINHIPGSFHLTSKSVFGSTTNSKYVPKAFLNVEDVQRFSKQNPEKRFVVKLKSNRGVKLQNVTDMNFVNSNSHDDYFAVEFIENPFLFNGHKFDFAVYVVITSINPLRLYYYNKNIIMRFCPKTYSTSDPEDRDRYVVKSSHIPGSKFPGIKDFFENDYTYKEGFNEFLKREGVDEDKVWKDVEDLIRSIVVSKKMFFIEEVRAAFNFFHKTSFKF